MALSKEKQQSLKALYETWGIDAVRRDLERNNHPLLVSPDVIAFEHAWVAAEEAKGPRRTQRIAALCIIVISLLSGTVAALLAF